MDEYYIHGGEESSDRIEQMLLKKTGQGHLFYATSAWP